MINWRKYNGALIPDHPPHVDVKFDEEDILKKIRNKRAYFARWTTDFDCKKETNFWYVIQDTPLDIKDYRPKIRNQIRRSLKKCIVRKIKKDDIINFGYDCYYNAFKKYNTHLIPLSKNNFFDYISSMSKDYEFWGVYSLDRRMIAFSINKVFGDYCDYSIMKFHPKYLRSRPSEALIFTMNKYYLNEQKFKYVNDGARSISHKTNIQAFLINKFKFRKAYCRLNIIYDPKIKFILSIVYPLRHIFSLFNFSFFKQLNILIFQEQIRRGCDK